MAWWTTFADGTKGTVELGVDELPPTPLDSIQGLQSMPYSVQEAAYSAYRGAIKRLARSVAEELGHGEVVSQEPLPYPASPILRRRGNCPPFCFQPDKCAGRSSCPRPHACDD